MDVAHFPLFLHCHIPKTAGVSVGQLLDSTFHPYHFNHYHSDPLYVLTPPRLETLLKITPTLRSISSHSLRTFPRQVCGRKTCYITFLRDPTAAFVSLLKYCRAEYRAGHLSAEARWMWPDDTPTRSLRDLAEWFLDQIGAENSYSPQTRFFCSPESMRKAGFTVEHQYGEDCFEVASMILERFLFVGVTEQIEKSVKLLIGKLKKLGIQVQEPALPHSNRSSSSEDLSWLTMRDKVGKRVLTCNEVDQQLYDRFRLALEREYARFQESAEILDISEAEQTAGPICEWAASRFLEKV